MPKGVKPHDAVYSFISRSLEYTYVPYELFREFLDRMKGRRNKLVEALVISCGKRRIIGRVSSKSILEAFDKWKKEGRYLRLVLVPEVKEEGAAKHLTGPQKKHLPLKIDKRILDILEEVGSRRGEEYLFRKYRIKRWKNYGFYVDEKYVDKEKVRGRELNVLKVTMKKEKFEELLERILELASKKWNEVTKKSVINALKERGVDGALKKHSIQEIMLFLDDIKHPYRKRIERELLKRIKLKNNGA